MLTIRSFNNNDPPTVLKIWNEKAKSIAEMYFGLTIEILEEQLFGSILFDPKSFFLAFDDEKPLGFLHATISHNLNELPANNHIGLIFPPVISPSVSNQELVIQALIKEAEKYFLNNNATCLFVVNGAPDGFPFYDILYGQSNPNGILADKSPLLTIFLSMQYKLLQEIKRFELKLEDYVMPVSEKIHSIYQNYVVHRIPVWSTDNFWDAFCYRNFFSTEWNVFPKNAYSGCPIAGAVLHEMMSQRSVAFFKNNLSFKRFIQPQRFLLSNIAVENNLLRHGIGSFLFSTIVRDILENNSSSTIIESVTSQDNERMIAFLLRHSFKEILSFHLLWKTITPS